MRAKKNMHKTIDSQRASKREWLSLYVYVILSIKYWTRTRVGRATRGQVYIHSYASRFPFPPLWSWWWLLFKGSKRRCQLYAWGSRKGLLSYLLSSFSADWISKTGEASACWVRRRISRISSTMIQLVGDLLTCCFECQHFVSASSMS